MDVAKATERLLKLAVGVFRFQEMKINFLFVDSEPFGVANLVLFIFPLVFEPNWRIIALQRSQFLFGLVERKYY